MTKQMLWKAWLVSIATAIAFVIFIRILVGATVYASGSGSLNIPIAATVRYTSTAIPSSPAQSLAYPSRLSIPALGIDAHVQDIGLAKSGALGTPNNFTDVGWYAYGVIPGEEGSAVIDGHVDNGLALAGVFKRLDSIKAGDDVYVTTRAGDRLRFTVTDVAWYGYTDVPESAIFTAKPGDKILKLITCGGDWVASSRTYDRRLIITAKLDE